MFSNGRHAGAIGMMVTCLVFSAEVSAAQLPQGVIAVDDDSNCPPSTGCGGTWGEAYKYLQDALAEADASGGYITEIWVAGGTYTPDKTSCVPDANCDEQTCDDCSGEGCVGGVCAWGSPRAQTFKLISGVSIYGGFVGNESNRLVCDGGLNDGDPCVDSTDCPEGVCKDVRDPDANVTILSGDRAANDGPNFTNYDENSYNVVTAISVDGSAILDGFTITAGNAEGTGAGMYNSNATPRIVDCTFSYNSADVWGGGMRNSNASPELYGCEFRGNRSLDDSYGGAAMYNSGTSSPESRECTFVENIACGDGGAIYNSTSGGPKFKNCRFEGNSGDAGGAMYIGAGCPIVIHSVFVDNDSETTCGVGGNDGGAVCADSCADATYINSRFLGNHSGTVGGVYLDGGGTEFVNCEFSGNHGGTGAGLRVNSGSGVSVVNSTFSGNDAGGSSGGGIYVGSNASPTIDNCIFWDNEDGGGTDESAQIHGGTPTVAYSCIQGCDDEEGFCEPPTHNTDKNPNFKNAKGADDTYGTEDDDVRLRLNSPCIDAADTDKVPDDTLDIDGNQETNEPVPWDLRHSANYPRIFDDTRTIDTGNSTDPAYDVVDMGAYEFMCTSDADCDDAVEDPYDPKDCTYNSCNVNTHVCTFPPKSSGTPCNDGEFCNGNDECDGSGTCENVGTWLPCMKPNQLCCESTESCYYPPVQCPSS